MEEMGGEGGRDQDMKMMEMLVDHEASLEDILTEAVRG